jgi:predicted DNA binding CopG/RHH family protein
MHAEADERQRRQGREARAKKDAAFDDIKKVVSATMRLSVDKLVQIGTRAKMRSMYC